MTRPLLVLTLLLSVPALAARGQSYPDRLLLRAEDPAVTELRLVLVRAGAGAIDVQAVKLETHGDTLQLTVNRAEPAVVVLPDRRFEMQIRAISGGPALHADMIYADEPARGAVSATGPVLLVSRDSIGARVVLGAAARATPLSLNRRE